MYDTMPVIHFNPAANFERNKADYECPLYKTATRAGVLSSVDHGRLVQLCRRGGHPDGQESGLLGVDGRGDAVRARGLISEQLEAKALGPGCPVALSCVSCRVIRKCVFLEKRSHEKTTTT